MRQLPTHRSFRPLLLGATVLSALALAGPARAADVALFANAEYVDTADTAEGEYQNVRHSLLALGHDVTPFVATNTPGLADALAGRDVVVIPEQETSPLGPDLSPDSEAVLRAFVDAGGTLVLLGGADAGEPEDLMNTAFGFGVSSGHGTGQELTRRPAADGTAFADGPESVPMLDATVTVDAASLPPGARDVYGVVGGGGGGGGTTTNPTPPTEDTGLYTVPYGDGTIVFLGWDWFSSTRPDTPGYTEGEADGGWQELLRRATSIGPTVEADPDPDPDPGRPGGPLPPGPPAPRPPGSGPLEQAARDLVAPVLTQQRLTRRVLAVHVSEAAAVEFRLKARRVKTERIDGRLRRRWVYKTIRTARVAAPGPGTVTSTLPAALARGRYRLRAYATDPAGNRARPVRRTTPVRGR